MEWAEWGRADEEDAPFRDTVPKGCIIAIVIIVVIAITKNIFNDDGVVTILIIIIIKSR